MRHLCLLLAFLAIAAAQRPRSTYTPETFWRDVVKGRRTGPDAEALFERSYKDALLPGAVMPGQGMRGIVISATPPASPTELVLAMSDESTPEATLRFIRGQSLGRPAPPGTKVEFEGVAKEFTRSPFMVIFEVEDGGVLVRQ